MTAGGWDEEIDEILGGDLTAALAYVTPAGGAVATPVAPIGLRDKTSGTVSFTTSQGFGRKLERIRTNPKVALAYHAREHGYAAGRTNFVLVQGTAHPREPDRATLEVIRPNVERFLGAPKTGRLFWDRWLNAYYADRLRVDIEVHRIVSWPTVECKGETKVHGVPLPSQPATSQPEPAKGTAPRVPVARAARRLRALPHRLVAAVGGDGYPVVLPCEIADAHGQEQEQEQERGMAIEIAPPGLDPGARRAGLLAHEYRPQLVGLRVRQHTGWLEIGEDRRTAIYAPYTEGGFAAPANKTVLLLANGLMARRGLRKAARAR